MDEQNNPTPPAVETGQKSLMPKLLITLAAVLVVGGLIWVLSSGDDDEQSQPIVVEQVDDQTESDQTETNQTEASATDDPDSSGTEASPPPPATTPPGQAPKADAVDQPPAVDSDPGANEPPADSSDQLPAGRYIDYQTQGQLDGLASSDRWLNFHADWCPFCQALDKNINENLEQIPDGVVIVKVDFDDNQDLRVRYGVTRQTVIIQIDAQGNEITRFNGYGINATLDNLNEAFGY